MTPTALSAAAHAKRSLLCVGLDPDPAKLPAHLPNTAAGVVQFCREIIAATEAHAIAYKVNTAFFEALGVEGWRALAEVAALLPSNTLRIADAKRGDIGNTASRYAEAFFHQLPFDALTVAPYMGHDSVTPFLAYPGKWVFLLGLTSNPGAADFQLHDPQHPLFEQVITTSQRWAAHQPGHLGFVAGATQTAHLARMRALAPEQWLLVPGVGAQGGDLDAVCQAAAIDGGGLLINASRSILYASSAPDFAQAAAREAQALAQATAQYLH